MNQHLIREIQDLRQEVDSLRQQQQVQEDDAQFSEDPRTQKILLQLWDHTQQLFRRIKNLEGEFYKDKQEREDPGSGPSPEDFESPRERSRQETSRGQTPSRFGPTGDDARDYD